MSGRGVWHLKVWIEDQAELAVSNEDIIRRFVEERRRTQTILPAISTIERLCADALVVAERRMEMRIANRLNDDLRVALDALLSEMVDDRLYRRIAETRITDTMLDVDRETGFTEAFTHLRTGAPPKDRIGLMNVLLAEGLNLGLSKMAEASNSHGFWELMRISRWHLVSDAYARALASVVEAQAALPMAGFWGTGRAASSDGQLFPTTRQGEAMNLINAKYGYKVGLKVYTHVSDQFVPFASQTIPATVSEAPLAIVLGPMADNGSLFDGLLNNGVGKRIREQYADTGGFTDHVFAVTAILGHRFIPRIRDLRPSASLSSTRKPCHRTCEGWPAARSERA